MRRRHIILHSLGHAVLVLIYTSGVAWVLFNGQYIFGKAQNFWGPLFILLLFVFSASIVGALVLGRPALLYLDGHKSEALKFFAATLGWILLAILIVFALHPWR